MPKLLRLRFLTFRPCLRLALYLFNQTFYSLDSYSRVVFLCGGGFVIFKLVLF